MIEQLLQVLALLVFLPIYIVIAVFIWTNAVGFAIGEMPPKTGWQTFKEMVLFAYCHLIGRPFLMLGKAGIARRIYNVANQAVVEKKNGSIVVTPKENAKK